MREKDTLPSLNINLPGAFREKGAEPCRVIFFLPSCDKRKKGG
jgi:hypothetical protein